MNPSPFIVGQVYKRSLIHDEYGGSRRGGISPSARYPYIFIFSGESGGQHGYKDQWENSEVFSYTGEGQVEDMRFIKGNLSLRDHMRSGKRIFLFMQTAKSFVKYGGELELMEYDFFVGPDRNGNDRLAIKFFFKRAGRKLSYQSEQMRLTKLHLQMEIPNPEVLKVTERQGLVTSRVGQGAYRKSILYRWDFSCAVTNYSRNDILIASHIVPWRNSSNEERLDVANGILLSPNYDALFDQNLISFENDGRIVLSDELQLSNYDVLGITGRERIKKFSHDNYEYLARHRELLLK